MHIKLFTRTYKRWLSLLTMVLVLSGLHAQAQTRTYTVDGVQYGLNKTWNGYYLTVTGSDEETVDLVIPESVNITLDGEIESREIPVWGFYGGEGFANCTKLRAVTFESGASLCEFSLTPFFPNQNIEVLNVGDNKDCVIYSHYMLMGGENVYAWERIYDPAKLLWFPGNNSKYCKKHVVQKSTVVNTIYNEEKGEPEEVSWLVNSEVSPTAFINSNIEELVIPGTMTISEESFAGCNKFKTILIGERVNANSLDYVPQTVALYLMNKISYMAAKEQYPIRTIKGGAWVEDAITSAGNLSFTVHTEESVTIKSINVMTNSSTIGKPEAIAVEPNESGHYEVSISPFLTQGGISVEFTHELSGEDVTYKDYTTFTQEVADDFSADPVIKLIRAENGLVECELLNTDYIDVNWVELGPGPAPGYRTNSMIKQPSGHYIGMITDLIQDNQTIRLLYNYKPDLGVNGDKEIEYVFANNHGLPKPTVSLVRNGHFKATLKLDCDLSKFAFKDYSIYVNDYDYEYDAKTGLITLYNYNSNQSDAYKCVVSLCYDAQWSWADEYEKDYWGDCVLYSSKHQFEKLTPTHEFEELSPYTAIIKDSTDYLDADKFERIHKWDVWNKNKNDEKYSFTSDDPYIDLSGLKSNTSYKVSHKIEIRYKYSYLTAKYEGSNSPDDLREFERGWDANYYDDFEFTTPEVVLTTKPAQAVSNDCAIICAETNLSENEIGTGFEWRRYDAPDLVPSTKVECPIYGGMMSGKLRGLSSNTYYKYRPYFEDPDGETVYGEWTAFGTADAYVYFEPTVYTYKPRMVGTDYAEVMAYALGGSDEITEQGIEYWPEARSRAAEGEVVKLTSTGQRMNFELTDLKPGTKYQVRAFATTAKETTYGEVQPFTTQGVPESVIEEVAETAEPTLYTVYTLSGQCVRRNAESLEGLRPGLYIINGRKHIVR